MIIPTLAGVDFLSIHKDIQETQTTATQGIYIWSMEWPINLLKVKDTVNTQYLPKSEKIFMQDAENYKIESTISIIILSLSIVILADWLLNGLEYEYQNISWVPWNRIVPLRIPFCNWRRRDNNWADLQNPSNGKQDTTTTDVAIVTVERVHYEKRLQTHRGFWNSLLRRRGEWDSKKAMLW